MKQCIILFILTMFTLVSCSSNCNVKCQGYVTDVTGANHALDVSWVYPNSDVNQAKQQFEDTYKNSKYRLMQDNNNVYPLSTSNCYCD